MPAIDALTHAVSADSNAAFKILPATTAKIDYQLSSIFARNSCPKSVLLQTLQGQVAHADVAAITSYKLFSGFRCNSVVYWNFTITWDWYKYSQMYKTFFGSLRSVQTMQLCSLGQRTMSPWNIVPHCPRVLQVLPSMPDSWDCETWESGTVGLSLGSLGYTVQLPSRCRRGGGCLWINSPLLDTTFRAVPSEPLGHII